MDQYNTLTPEIISKLKEVSDHILTGDDINPDFSRDEMPIYGTHMPDLVVQPRSTEEVAAVMKICYENTIPVTPRGAGTGLAGGAVPVRIAKAALAADRTGKRFLRTGKAVDHGNAGHW